MLAIRVSTDHKRRVRILLEVFCLHKLWSLLNVLFFLLDGAQSRCSGILARMDVFIAF